MKRKLLTGNVRPKFELKNIKIKVLMIACAVFAMASIFITIESSTSGAEFAKLQSDEAALLTKQQDLQQTLVETLSINTLAEQSSELGFAKLSNLVYIQDAVGAANGTAVASVNALSNSTVAKH